MIHRSTRQLSAVLAAVSAERDHPTAQVVYERVRCRIPSISRSTVYRNLNKLERAQQLRALRLADGPIVYDGMLQEHDHFICEQCERIRDLAPVAGRGDQGRELRDAGYAVARQSVTYYGICPSCVARR